MSEHKAAFHAYVRTGEMTGLKRLEEKALTAGSDPDGGYLVPEETEAEIGRRLTAVSPIRAISGIPPGLHHPLQEAFRHHRPGRRLVRRDRCAAADHLTDLGRTDLPGDGALRHAGGHPDTAG